MKLLGEDAVLMSRSAVRFPVELKPSDWVGEDVATWPAAEGRLEWVEGRLLYMPPCADVQQDVAVDVIHLLRSWSADREGFIVGANEAGMKLGRDIRAADAAVWAKSRVGPSVGRLRSVPPLLAVEVAGQDEEEPVLRHKACWYLEHGVCVVWLVIPERREVLFLRQNEEVRCEARDRLPESVELPGLAPSVAEFFLQLDRA